MIATITIQLTLAQLMVIALVPCTIGLFFGMLMCREVNKAHDEDSTDEDKKP